MSQPWNFYAYVFPLRKDPDNPGHYLCRFCGKSTTHTRKYYYCSDECRTNCEIMVNWQWTRRLVWERDGKQCVRCGKPVRLHDGKNMEIHHIITANNLWKLACEIVEEEHPETDDNYDIRIQMFARLWTALYLHLDNLITLCGVCHVKEHGKVPKVALYY